MYDLRILGQNLKRYRQFCGLTQEELAKKVGLTKDTISKIELGKQKNPGLKYLAAISQELDLNLAELFMADPEEKVIKLVISDQNFQALEKLFKDKEFTIKLK